MGSTILELRHGEQVVSGIDVRHEARLPFRNTSLSHVAYVNSERIPWFLISQGPFPVYSSDETTTGYFKEKLAREALDRPYIGILSKSQDPQTYVVFFIQGNGVRCFCIDFTTLDRLSTASRNFEAGTDDNVYYSALPTRSDTTIFDRVLENKSSKRNQYVAPKNPSSTPLSVTPLNGDQISNAVNKMTLSGLRLRGLNPSSSSKDRIAIKELYHMTRKSALFALRKFNYGFNGSSGQEVRLSDVQDVVERLLQAYADVDQPA
ncbi:hypothetical protein FT663_02968 [Candidozyma haemuli var. vulneris]|uniref:Mitochondrial morphogenesis protein SLD7 n=1 Tax=Candidozyma haemuli TaxID=45357 RepID=A0A2V1ANU8_9ASCO|nr:hypothetical protein CXQ85_001537 [[Candida] haemuloni]KAF3990895.1 hypothetical protein FT663_02968 [[Candida] haemuloni var. vulneris]KAF3992765.1 hypothetical protein FT662_00974 [[Candida] haemuloni var. vulneris]PVH19236.1 hypothetical protein CXQ85_001537 [[Candida] haemuloni]